MKYLFIITLLAVSNICLSQDHLVFCAKKRIGSEGEFYDNQCLFTIAKDHIILTESADSLNHTYKTIKTVSNASEGSIKYYFGKYDCITWYTETGLIIIQKNFKLVTYKKCEL